MSDHAASLAKRVAGRQSRGTLAQARYGHPRATRTGRGLRAATAVGAFLLLAASAHAAAPPAPAAPGVAHSPVVAEAAAPGNVVAQPVTFRGTRLLEVREPIGTLTVAERAAAIERRLELAAALPDSTLAAVRTQRRAGSFDVYAGEQFVMSVTAADAAPLGRTPEQRAADVAVLVREALRREYAERSAAGVLRASVLTAASLGLAFALWLALGRGIGAAERLLAKGRGAAGGDAADAPDPAGAAVSAGRLLSAQVADLLAGLLRLTKLALGLLLAVFWFGYALSLYPWTRGIAAAMDTEIRAVFRALVRGVVDYVPNLVYIVVFVVVFRLLIKFARLFFERVASGSLRIAGFHAEWGPPTFQIVRVLLVAFAVAVIFPYLPASDSRAFQGVTVLLGVVLSFGSATAVANLIGGLVITYMRALAVGDRVKIGEAEGDVVGRDAFVVRVRTIKNVEITIPNAAVLSGPVVNYSAGARDGGLLLHTSVTIGYDAPWRQVHELLIAAARRTRGVEAAPAPFVLQTGLGDFAVAYQVNAYTREPSRGSAILSELHAHIQDEFALAGIEIMSPAYEGDPEQRKVPPVTDEMRAAHAAAARA